MKLNKPKFWDEKKNFISILFFPLSLVVLLFIYIKKKITKVVKFNIPIICVGNIYLGGTGKTPTSIFFANALLRLGKKPVILRKYYKDHSDEYDLIKNEFNSLILNHNRIEGIKEAEENNFNCIILDDGFQDYKIEKDLNIVCFNENQLVGNGLVIPSGPLRESLNALSKAHIILINGKKNISFEKKILDFNKDLEIFYSYYKPTNLNQFRNKKLLAIAAIGNPENFFKLLIDNGLNIEKKLIFPDHYVFSKNEIIKIVEEATNKDYQIVTTEKDYFKIKNFNIHKIKYLKVSFYLVLIQKLTN